MACLNPNAPQHRWPRLFASKRSSGGGSTEIWHCNDCMAMKIVFIVYSGDDDGVRTEVIAEPKGQGDVQAP